MLPTFVIIICPNCQEDLHDGFFENPDYYLGKYVACPFCNKKFDFGLRMKDANILKKYDYDKELSERELLLNNEKKFISLHKNSPLYNKHIGNKKLSHLGFFAKILLKKKAKQEKKLLGKLKKWSEYSFYKDLLTLLENKNVIKRRPIFDDEKNDPLRLLSI